MNYQDYEIPKNLIFDTQDILDMHGLKCSVLADPQEFKDLLAAPSQITKVRVYLSFSVLSKEILVQGAVKGSFQTQCARCLKTFEKKFDEEFTQLYPTKDEIIDIMYLTKQTLALLAGIQELCSKDCKGLCAFCGCNKNEVSCDCKPPVTSPFACLKDKFLKTK